MSLPIVSVIVPAYNAELMICEAIESVLGQSYTNFELIICDDASMDRTIEAIKSYADRRIRLIRNGQNLGEGASRDNAISVARGEWVAMLDADDAWHRDRLTKMLDAAENRNDIMVFDDIMECHHTQHGLRFWRRIRGRHAYGAMGQPIHIEIDRWVASKRLVMQPLIPTAAIRAAKVVHSNRRFAADTEFFLKLLASGLKMCYVPEAYYYYRISPGSMTGVRDRYKNMKEVLEHAMADFSDNESVVRALQWRLDLEKRNESYGTFVWALKDRDYRKAARYFLRAPWVIEELTNRTVREMPYHAHRIWHRGTGRASR